MSPSKIEDYFEIMTDFRSLIRFLYRIGEFSELSRNHLRGFLLPFIDLVLIEHHITRSKKSYWALDLIDVVSEDASSFFRSWHFWLSDLIDVAFIVWGCFILLSILSGLTTTFFAFACHACLLTLSVLRATSRACDHLRQFRRIGFQIPQMFVESYPAGYPIQGVKSIVWLPVINMSWCSVMNVECRPQIFWRICSHCHCTAFLFHHPLSVQRSLIEFQCKGAEGFSLKSLHVGWWVHCRFVYFWLNIEHTKRWFKSAIMFPSQSDI